MGAHRPMGQAGWLWCTSPSQVQLGASRNTQVPPKNLQSLVYDVSFSFEVVFAKS